LRELSPRQRLIEAFNSKFRAVCLNQLWFLTFADAREKKESWRNEVRPHSVIGYSSAPTAWLILTKTVKQPKGKYADSTSHQLSDGRYCAASARGKVQIKVRAE
jgi:hypothetical protein